MVLHPLKQLALPTEAGAVYDRWLTEIEDQLADEQCDRYRLCRDTLFDLYHPASGRYEDLVRDARTSLTTKAALLALDPHNITLEPEYYDECDVERYGRVKPLLWLWQCFDRSPLGGGNVDVGVRLRRILAPHIFKRCGKNFKCFQFVEFSFGYNLEVGDDVVVHRHVLLDDRGGIALGNRVSIADYANIYSHTHSIVNQTDVTNATTVLGDGVRITYHATVLAGVHVGEESMVGACAVATRDVRPYHVNLGIPAKSVRVKPNAPTDMGDTLDTSRQRQRPSG
jgi:acetyltransferase-like isoleucine patch superfamily enzyme